MTTSNRMTSNRCAEECYGSCADPTFAAVPQQDQPVSRCRADARPGFRPLRCRLPEAA